jgi:hypothetical protein
LVTWTMPAVIKVVSLTIRPTRVVTPGGCQIGCMDHTGCHQLDCVCEKCQPYLKGNPHVGEFALHHRGGLVLGPHQLGDEVELAADTHHVLAVSGTHSKAHLEARFSPLHSSSRDSSSRLEETRRFQAMGRVTTGFSVFSPPPRTRPARWPGPARGRRRRREGRWTPCRRWRRRRRC